MIPGTSWLRLSCPPWPRQSSWSTVPILPNLDSTPSNPSSMRGLALEGTSDRLVLRIPSREWLSPSSPGGYTAVLGSVRCYPMVFPAPLTDIVSLQILERVELYPVACLLGVVRVCYLVLLSLCCCFNVRTEKLCCNQHLPRILSMCLHTGGMMWITYVTANVVKSTIFLKCQLMFHSTFYCFPPWWSICCLNPGLIHWNNASSKPSIFPVFIWQTCLTSTQQVLKLYMSFSTQATQSQSNKSQLNLSKLAQPKH